MPSPEPAAVLSSDGRYRYFLSRRWSRASQITFIGLNPSTADATLDDPTIRRCVRFARDWGAGALYMVNLFAYRSTDPSTLLRVGDPVGPENDEWLDRAVSGATTVVAAWGNQGALLGRHEAIKARYEGQLQALKITSKGMPGHPLYISASEALKPFN